MNDFVDDEQFCTNKARLQNRDKINALIQEKIKEKWGPEGLNIGVRLIFGGWDAVCKKSVILQWLENLPQLKGNVKIFNNESHFIQETKPNYIAEKILESAELI